MMTKPLLKIIVFLLLVSPMIAFSQESNFGNWLIYIGNKQLNEKWNIHNEIQYRNYDAIGDLEQLLLRTGLGYNLSPNNNNVLLGYGYILSENYNAEGTEKTTVNEHRIFQQFITKQNIGKVKVSHRYRFEQRFIEDDFRLRFRYFLALAVPLFQLNDAQKQIYLSAYDELFINGDSPIFDRNRLYGGLGLQVNKNLKIEAGYMNQFFEKSSRDQFNIITLLTF